MKKMLRYATEADKEQLKEIWKCCFDDPESFVKFFFEKRYTPDYTVVYEKDGKILSCIHSLPLKISIRDSVVNGAVMSGVATLPEARGRGLMRSTLGFFMNGMREKGLCIISHRPQTTGLYDFAGHYIVSTSRYIFAESGRNLFNNENKFKTELADIPDNLHSLYRCYSHYAAGYSGMIMRTIDDFRLKMSDYLSCGAKCITIKNSSGEIRAYCIFFDDDEILADECVASDKGFYIPLLSELFNYNTAKKTTARCAVDTPVPDGAKLRDEPKGTAGVCNVQSLLLATGSKSQAVIRVIDPMIPQNNGVFTLSGECSQSAPVLEISAGGLLQWALGYKKAEELISSGRATALHGFNADDFSLSPDKPCFTVDEY